MKKRKFSSSMENELAYKQWLQVFPHDISFDVLPSINQLQETVLAKQIYNYLSKQVPTLLRKIPKQNISTYVLEEDLFMDTVCQNIEGFICGEEGFASLSKFNKPAKFCGKVFQQGDPTYTCKECASDPTCVFCHDCFNQSPHKNHRYKMHASGGGGGYCDCGDEEAWRESPACRVHMAGMLVDAQHDPLACIPDDIVKRAKFILITLLNYCVDMISWKETKLLPPPLTIRSEKGLDSFIVMLFNDESHSYHDVISKLKETVKASREQATNFAFIVDTEGRSAIYTGELAAGEKVAGGCRKRGGNEKTSLKCEVLHRDVVAHQLAAINLMHWFADVVANSDAFRRLFVTLSSIADDSLLDRVIINDAQYWKMARASTHQLFMNSILIDTCGRIVFAKAFAKNYKSLVENFLQDDHKHSISVSSMSVQIFTVPTIAELLILEYNMLRVVLQTFVDALQSAVQDGQLNLQKEFVVNSLDRMDFILRDLGYLLKMEPSWNKQLEKNFLDAFKVVIRLFQTMQGMESLKMMRTGHVVYEPTWQPGFNLTMSVMTFIEYLLNWCYSEKSVFVRCIEMCLTELYEDFHLKHSKEDPFVKMEDYDVINHQVNNDNVSLFAPFSRLVVGLFCGASAHNVNIVELFQEEKRRYAEHLDRDLNHGQVFNQIFIEYPLRALVLSAQVSSGMWKRNGLSLLNSVMYYQNVRFAVEMYDRDIQCLQFACTFMDSEELLYYIQNKFDILQWTKESYTPKDESDEKQTIAVAEDFVLTLFFMLSERYTRGIGVCDQRISLRREIIHRLAVQPTVRSTLVNSLPYRDMHEMEKIDPLLDEILKEVAEYREPGLTMKGHYVLKPEFYAHCCQFFIHYSRTDRSKMLDEQRTFFKKKERNDNAPFYARPPAFVEQLKPILNLLESDSLHRLLKLVLHRAVNMKSVTFETVELVLLIIAVGLMEKSNPNMNVFVRKLQEISLTKALDLIIKKSKEEFVPLAKWVKEIFENSQDVCQPTSTFSSSEGDKQDAAARRKVQAKLRRQQIMAEMSKMQTDFMEKHSEEFSEIEMDITDGDNIADPVEHPTCVFSPAVSPAPTEPALCILCQEEHTEGDRYVVMVFVHQSSVYGRKKGRKTSDTPASHTLPLLDNNLTLNVQSCGHVLHSKCWDEYLKVVNRIGSSGVDMTKTEYPCPLCYSLCNSVLLMSNTQTDETTSVAEIGIGELLAYMEKFISQSFTDDEKKGASRTDSSRRLPTSSGFRASQLTDTVRRFFVYVGSENDNKKDYQLLFQEKLIELEYPDDIQSKSLVIAIPLAWNAFSSTLQAIECQHRLRNKNIFFNVSERQSTFLQSFVKHVKSCSTTPSFEPLETYTKHVFRFVCCDDTSLSLGEIDCFGLMVGLYFNLTIVHNTFNDFAPAHLPLANVVFKLALTAQVVKTFLAAPLFTIEDADNDLAQENGDIVKTYTFLKKLSGIPVEKVDGAKLKEHIFTSLLPFLRCSAYFFHLLNNVPLPHALTNQETIKDEFGVLSCYLNLPTDVLLESWLTSDQQTSRMVQRFCKQSRAVSIHSGCGLTARRFIKLPHDYSTLINMASGFKCPSLGGVSRCPVICLLCSEMLCSQCETCTSIDAQTDRRVGACALHTTGCSGDAGVFFEIRECELFVIYDQSRGAALKSPYLDQYGEMDKGFRRGNPLFLNERRYESVELIWLQDRIAQTIAQRTPTHRYVRDWSRY